MYVDALYRRLVRRAAARVSAVAGWAQLAGCSLAPLLLARGRLGASEHLTRDAGCRRAATLRQPSCRLGAASRRLGFLHAGAAMGDASVELQRFIQEFADFEITSAAGKTKVRQTHKRCIFWSRCPHID